MAKIPFSRKYQNFRQLILFFRKRLPTRKYLWFLIIAYIGYQFAQFIFNDSFSSTKPQSLVKPEVHNVPPEVPENHPENEPEVEVKPENAPEIDDIFEQIKIETNLEKLQELNKQIQVQKILLLVRFELMTFIFRLVSMI